MIDFYHKIDSIRIVLADVVELVDTLDLGSSAVRCGSSSLPIRTNLNALDCSIKSKAKQIKRFISPSLVCFPQNYPFKSSFYVCPLASLSLCIMTAIMHEKHSPQAY